MSRSWLWTNAFALVCGATRVLLHASFLIFRIHSLTAFSILCNDPQRIKERNNRNAKDIHAGDMGHHNELFTESVVLPSCSGRTQTRRHADPRELAASEELVARRDSSSLSGWELSSQDY